MSTVAARMSRPSGASGGRRVLGAAATVGGLVLACKGVSFARDLVVAARLGTTDSLDAFLMAGVVPAIAVNVVAGSFNAALIPTYVRVRDLEGRDAADRLVSSVQVVSFASLAALTALLALLTPVILETLAAGFGPVKLAATRRLSYILLPGVALSGLATIWSAVLNAGDRFALAALAPAAVPLVSAALLLASTGGGADALAVGFLGGVLLQAGLVGWGLRTRGGSIALRWRGGGPAFRSVVGQYLPMTVGALLMNGTVLVDQAMAARLGPGSVAVLSYGNKVVALALNVVSGALGTAVLPEFSRRVAAGDWAGIRAALRGYAALILALTVPLTAGLVACSPTLVRLLFQRGTFTAADASSVGGVQAMYALQIPFYTMGILLVRLISAMSMSKALMYGTAISFLLNIVFDLIFMRYLGTRGIALASSAIYMISFVYLSIVATAALRRRAMPCA